MSVDHALVRGEVLWTPPDDCWETTAFGRFAARCGFDRDADGLLAWSRTHLDDFWSASCEFTGVRWMRPPDVVREGDTMPGVRWFPGATLNYADQALAPASAMPDAIAVVAESQTRGRIELTWAELRDVVRRCAAGLRRLGVGPGTRVVAYAPNIPETLVAFLAAASLGAVWSSCAPEFGVRSVIDRFRQIEPHVLLAVDGYRYGAKDIDRVTHGRDIAAALDTLAHVVHVPYLRPGEPTPPATRGVGVTVHSWDELVAADATGGNDDELTFTPVPADHPLYVLFSSGTTGLPKAIVHGHGGIVAEHLKIHRLHHDLGRGDRFFWFTTTGWMMWNYLVSGLLVGATIVLFDGDPGSPVARRAVGSQRRRRDHRLRHVGVVHHELPQGRRATVTRRAAVRRLDRLAAAGRRVPLGDGHARRAGGVDVRRHRHLHRVRRARRRCNPSAPARSAGACSGARSRRSRRRGRCARLVSPASS